MKHQLQGSSKICSNDQRYPFLRCFLPAGSCCCRCQSLSRPQRQLDGRGLPSRDRAGGAVSANSERPPPGDTQKYGVRQSSLVPRNTRPAKFRRSTHVLTNTSASTQIIPRCCMCQKARGHRKGGRERDGRRDGRWVQVANTGGKGVKRRAECQPWKRRWPRRERPQMLAL